MNTVEKNSKSVNTRIKELEKLYLAESKTMDEIISNLLEQNTHFSAFIKALECCCEWDNEEDQNRGNCSDCPFEYADGTAACWMFEEGQILLPSRIVRVCIALLNHARKLELNSLYSILQARKHDAEQANESYIEVGLDELETVLRSLKKEEL